MEIIMQDKYKAELNEYVGAKERENRNYFSLFHANFDEFQHSMIVEELAKIYDELSFIEVCELCDYFKLEQNGRTNKKR